jgi:Methyltransferase domain
MSGIRGAYVSGVKSLRRTAERVGLLARLERSASPRLRHVRTLFSIFDAADMTKMDLAWWCYPAMRRVEAFLADRPRARVFEYGAGASTVWLAKRARQVDSVEHDAAWAEHVRELLAGVPSATVHVVPATPATTETVVRSGRVGHTDLDFGDYVAAIDQIGGVFDLIVVDGRARTHAFGHALDHLADGGVIVFDNLKRKRYWNVISATTSGLRFELLKGATPTLPYPTTTGLIWRD